jgi:spermidine/putrescine transport system substrate-binding protein
MRKNRTYAQIFIAAIFTLTLLLSGCGSAATPTPTALPIATNPPEPTAIMPTEPAGPVPVSGDINVVTWAGYDGTAFTDPFYAANPNANLNFSLITSDNELFTKIQSGYPADAICSVWEKLYIENNLLQPIDTSRLTNWSSIPESLTRNGIFNGQQYFVPFDWSFVSILVRTDKVSKIPTKWADLWDPAYKGHVAIIDDPSGAAVYAAWALGLDPWTTTAEQDAAIEQKLIDLKPNLLTFWSDPYAMVQSVADGDLWVVGGAWASSYVMLTAQDIPVQYIEPTDGGRGMWIGYFSIPADAANVDGAYAYIDTMISQSDQVNVGNWGIGMANFDAISLLDTNLVAQMGMNDLTLLDRTRFLQDTSMAQMKIWNAMWTRVKAAP